MKFYDVPFIKDRFDDHRMNEAGGYITDDKHGRIVRRFPGKLAFDKYKALNSKRYEGVK